MAPNPKPPHPPKNEPLGLRRKADLPSGRPLTPTPLDLRIEAVKTWSESARGAARAAFERATTAGASREEAVEAGYLAGLRVHLDEKELSPPAVDLVAHAASLFGARVVAVLPADRETTALEERCFEMACTSRDSHKPARRPATPPRRRESADEDKKKTPAKDPRPALTGKLAGQAAPGRRERTA
jgi:hypothetical protein